MKKPYNKKKRARVLLVAILLAIAVCAGALACFNATLKRGEKNKTRESVAEWTQQNARLLQYKMDRYYDTLENVDRSVQNLPMNSQETQKKIGRNFPTEDTHFICIRALDLEGKNPEFTGSWKDQQYFKDSLAGNRGIGKNGSTYKSGVVLSVPVYDNSDQVKGVICGVLSPDSLNIFTDSEEAMERRDLYVTDKDGTYIVKQDYEGVSGDNLYTDLSGRELSVKLENIRFRVSQNMKVCFSAAKTEDDVAREYAIVQANGQKLNVVTVMKEKTVLETSTYYQKYLYLLIFQLIMAVLVVVWIYLRMIRDDRIYIKNLNKRLELSEETYRVTARNNDVCIFTYDVETGLIQFLNEKYKELGLGQAQLSIPVLMKKIQEINPSTCAEIEVILKSVDDKLPNFEHKFVLWSGGRKRYLHVLTTNIFDNMGKVARMVGSIEDITTNESDPLTGVLRRAAGIEQIEQILLTSPGVGRVHAFMIADLDNFKSLNDKLGHMWGDRALQDVAKIMKNDCRPRDVICRLGGDEFVLFLQNLPEREVESFAEGLSRRLHLTYSDGSQSVSITASMGIILAGRSETSFQELYARADKELYEVKRTGKGTWHIKE